MLLAETFDGFVPEIFDGFVPVQNLRFSYNIGIMYCDSVQHVRFSRGKKVAKISTMEAFHPCPF